MSASLQPTAFSLARTSAVTNFFMSRLLNFFFEFGSFTTGTCANSGTGQPNASYATTCTDVFVRCSAARTTCVIFSATSSTTVAKL